MWHKIIALLLMISVCAKSENMFDPYLDLKTLKTSADRIRGHGYPAETHYVQTSDNYVLGVFRIPYSHKLNNQNQRKPVILLQHGLFSCSDCFLLNGPDDALAYLLADAGYDVWLGNGRGNIYSRNNTRISPNHPDFWKFSWHEIAVIDMADTIDYILKVTGETKIHYAGHSQGTTVYLILLSERPEYNEKIKTGHLLAPAAYMTHSEHFLLTRLWPYVGEPGTGTKLLDNQQFAPSNPYLQRVLDTFCGGMPQFPGICKTLFFLFAGPDEILLNMTLVPQIAETHPAGIGTNQGIHYIQLHLSEKFRQYDHGAKGNLQRYGQLEPPDYELENISANTYMYYSEADMSTNYTDVELLPARLGASLKHFYKVPDPRWSHIDFIFAEGIKEEINDQVVAFCQAYETGLKIQNNNQ